MYETKSITSFHPTTVMHKIFSDYSSVHWRGGNSLILYAFSASAVTSSALHSVLDTIVIYETWHLEAFFWLMLYIL